MRDLSCGHPTSPEPRGSVSTQTQMGSARPCSTVSGRPHLRAGRPSQSIGSARTTRGEPRHPHTFREGRRSIWMRRTCQRIPMVRPREQRRHHANNIHGHTRVRFKTKSLCQVKTNSAKRNHLFHWRLQNDVIINQSLGAFIYVVDDVGFHGDLLFINFDCDEFHLVGEL